MTDTLFWVGVGLMALGTATLILTTGPFHADDYLVTAWRGFCATFQNGGRS